jgi:class 3 adenylate cyclase/alpha-beta hydrolase superfamily lysophospholipase
VSVPRTLYARSGEVHLAYQVIGDGPRDVVLVLDWASHLEALWEHALVPEFVAALNRFARVIWFDMRGVGLSDRVVDSAVSAEDWLEDVTAVMDAAGSERATIVGHGHAVQLALLFAATHPERVDSLVLINGFARLLRSDDYPVGMPPEARDTVLEGIASNWGTGRLATVLAPSVASQPGVQDWYARVERYAASPGTALSKMQAISELDVRNVLPSVAAPTLVVHNRDDAFIRVGHGRYLAEHIGGARLLERDSADHWPIGDADLLGAIEEFVVGSRSEDTGVDRFLATVLFLDVAGSTERMEEIGDRSWDALLERFEATVERMLRTHRGELVNTAGDGMLATFDGPARGIRCAWTIRDALRQNGLEVRSGLHTGELTRRNEGVTGIAVHIGARVSALAEPGEVLVTRTVRDLVAGSGIAFEARGEHALKGVADRWTLYAATG